MKIGLRIGLAGLCLSGLLGCRAQGMLERELKPGAEFSLTTAGQSVEDMTYEGDGLRFQFQPDVMQILTRVDNLSAGTVKVVWDKSILVDPEGQSHAVFHSAVKELSALKAPMPDTLIASGSGFKAGIFPADSLKNIDMNMIARGAVIQQMLIESGFEKSSIEPYLKWFDPVYSEAQKKVMDAHPGKTVRLILAIERDGSLKEYPFEFTLKKVTYANE